MGEMDIASALKKAVAGIAVSGATDAAKSEACNSSNQIGASRHQDKG
ncbi:MAG: hypothetical protein PHY05_08755 [Methanothrix sp.]|nr:hypothetical protein [Methanothrix sp.]